MLSHELSDVFLMHEVVMILLPAESSAIEKLVPHAGVANVLHDSKIVVRQSWNLASLPSSAARLARFAKVLETCLQPFSQYY